MTTAEAIKTETQRYVSACQNAAEAHTWAESADHPVMPLATEAHWRYVAHVRFLAIARLRGCGVAVAAHGADRAYAHAEAGA